jgi:hypothetical protein
MIEQRQYHRVALTEKCALVYQDTIYQGELENISLNGAVVTLTESASLPKGVICLLIVYLNGESNPLRLNVEVIHRSLPMLGVRFVPLDEYGQNRLVHLVQKFSTDPDKLETELDSLKWHITNYLRAS